jgi:ATP-dependent Clp protease ATP-binding subunit ClpC
MTSNLGTADLRRQSIGFGGEDGDDVSYESIKEKVNDALKKHFRPEFLNRIDEVIAFHELTVDEVKQIVDLFIDRIQEQLSSQGLEVVLSEPAKELIGKKGYDPQLGARPLRRSIQRMMEDPLSEKILFGEFHAGSTILVDVDAEDPETLVFEAVDTPDSPPVELADSEEGS